MVTTRRQGRSGFLPWTVAAAVGGSVLALVSFLAPGVDLAYGSAGMHVGLNAIGATVCLLVAALAAVRYLRTQQLRDLIGALAFAVVVVENAFFLIVPTLLNFEQIQPLSVWSSSASTVLWSALLLGAAVTPRGRTVSSRCGGALAAVTLAALATIAAIVYLLESRLPLAVDPALFPSRLLPAFTGEAGVLAVQGFAGVALLVGAGAFARSRASDEQLLQGWLGPALVAAALAAGCYAVFPTLYSDWVSVGDILRGSAYVILAVGIVAEIRAATKRTIELAVLEERRRLARDLHDGVAQELAFIATELDGLAGEPAESLSWIRSSAERALHESRRTIAALTLPLDLPLQAALAEQVDDIARRAGASVSIEVPSDIELSGDRREAILRIVREATVNAVRHGHASSLQVTLRADGPRSLSLRVADDGTGFDPAAVGSGRFGLTIMRERAVSAGGRLRLESSPGAGTTVQASWTD